ncbi:unnamed protein product [Polarella glacialis]|uniref:Tyrosine specific protein phosphatases domain-containing protein n=1 Tax=Polarella glacialis TaxID=89957 RepID=A0A813L1K4_POLGL|nr:unnamed protein product [Polarella glacialis]
MESSQFSLTWSASPSWLTRLATAPRSKVLRIAALVVGIIAVVGAGVCATIVLSCSASAGGKGKVTDIIGENGVSDDCSECDSRARYKARISFVPFEEALRLIAAKDPVCQLCFQKFAVLEKDASNKYSRQIYAPMFSERGEENIPFNELPEYSIGPGYWFWMPLQSGVFQDMDGQQIKGQLLTTRMPRSIDKDWPAKDPAGNYPGWLTDPAKKDPNPERQLFKTRVAFHGLRNVLALVADEEPPAANSSQLWEYYDALNLVVLRAPSHDFNVPGVDQFKKAVESISLALYSGHSTVVHCWGGSGRTGTFTIGVLKNLGIFDPVDWARAKGKSVYLDVVEQEKFISQMPFVATPLMYETSPALINSMLVAHLRNVGNKLVAGKLSKRELDDDTKAVLELVWAQPHPTALDAAVPSKWVADAKDVFMDSMSTVVPTVGPMTAKDRQNMPAGSGEIGAWPKADDNEARQATPVMVPGDFWSNTMGGDATVSVPAGSVHTYTLSDLWQ